MNPNVPRELGMLGFVPHPNLQQPEIIHVRLYWYHAGMTTKINGTLVTSKSHTTMPHSGERFKSSLSSLREGREEIFYYILT